MSLGFTDFSMDEIYLLFRRFEKGGQGQLTYNDFSRILLPFSREYASLITDRSEYYGRRSRDGVTFFNADTRHELQAFWATMLRTERAMEILRARLNQRPYMNLREVFEVCTRSRTGLILAQDLREVLAESGFYSTERELQGLMYRLDGDNDSCISFKDFMDELSPKMH